MRVLWERIINALLPNYVIAAIKSSRQKPDTGLAYRRKDKCITRGSLPAFVLRFGWTWAAGCQEAAPTVHPHLTDTWNPATTWNQFQGRAIMMPHTWAEFSEFIKRFYLRFYIWSLGKPCELVIYSLFYKWGYRVTLWLTALIKVTQLVRGGVWVQAHIFLVWNPLLLTNLIKPQHLIIKRDVRGHVAPSACWGAQWVPRQCISSLSTHSCLFE